MKNLKFLTIILASMFLLSACESALDGITTESGIEMEKSKQPEVRTVPFNAEFFTVRSYDAVLGECTEDPFFDYNLQRGSGNATHLGKFTTTMWFCGYNFDYKNGTGVFVAANGDELYFQIPTEGVVGHVIPFAHPFYEAYFQDPFTFSGGTGRFAGASGG